MKKIVSILLTLVMLLSLAVAVSADDAEKAKIYDAFLAACPEEYHNLHAGTVQNVLSQIDVTAEQADEVVALIEAAKGDFTVDKGSSLSNYTAEERAIALDYVDKAAEVLNVEVEIVSAANPIHEGDSNVVVTYNGAQIATVDGDPVKVTGGNNSATAVYAVLALVASISAVVVTKKYVLD